MSTTMWPVRIMINQSTPNKAKQAAMIASQDLEVLVYRQAYHIGIQSQRDDLLETLRSEFGGSVTLPDMDQCSRLEVYLFIVGNAAFLVPEGMVLPWVHGFVLGRKGLEAADRVTYLTWMTVRKINPDSTPERR